MRRAAAGAVDKNLLESNRGINEFKTLVRRFLETRSLTSTLKCPENAGSLQTCALERQSCRKPPAVSRIPHMYGSTIRDRVQLSYATKSGFHPPRKKERKVPREYADMYQTSQTQPVHPTQSVMYVPGKYISRKHFTYSPIQIFKIMIRRFLFSRI